MTSSRRVRRRWVLLGALAVLAAAFLAGRVVAGQFRAVDPSAFATDLATGAPVRVAGIPARDGRAARGVFAAVTAGGQLCVWDAPAAGSPQRQGGCNPASEPLGGSALSASLAYEGGPAVEDVRDARLIGLADRSVARVELLMSDGTTRGLRLEPAAVGSRGLLAFGFRVARADLARGVGPVAVVARDADGTELARQATGIGG
jgi:hypothetical protein